MEFKRLCLVQEALDKIWNMTVLAEMLFFPDENNREVIKKCF